MTVEKVDATVADFDAHFDKLFAAGDDAEGKVKLLLFLADRDASSNQTWCPDCNVAEPVIYDRVEAAAKGKEKDVVLLRAYVGDKPTWRDPAHPWRADPRFRLTGVPTLIRWENGAAAARLGDDEAHLADKVDAVVNAAN
ncbi:thioredoxin-like protein Clot [Oryza sativa Japonica Group]|jgi:thiol-disulfide isomerase/thioredoxin|uniref:Thioredoxin-like protein Clot n=5 Tax=Oryza TaxID=4527 RepID=OCLOT_ORYSJ|nr:thioredoxin-like protein Clot [Oryza sativa Japonica Group]Q5Z9Z3.1 RecName: Full=Thioredoxin-like protein Clot; AltName: Full=Thioredoxin Clot; Short=OsClot [Oryza sativa Japonica Group]EAZ00725.1 hypothetical protein OsI_22750 [Oryza sativa Indica Group]KAB8102295.1 hypothetical protein EE612_033717 [Oryza sativa]EAZ36813.1 hypothetical protein OsJ_21152 [Oryza sativa Japonica Group]KAF2926544.1 hypothetical protein DAI22_06g135400 [Oryza sativa Japonica Group]BAD61617.1 hypothetical pro|eukprot:NP_001057509.1 Os06g0320000 [Oryza sativa Japonica Group]